MSAAAAGAASRGTAHGRSLGAADRLGLAATPTFGLMALLTGNDAAMTSLCSAAPGASVLGGMLPMYVAMSAFHAGPWLRLFPGRRERTA